MATLIGVFLILLGGIVFISYFSKIKKCKCVTKGTIIDIYEHNKISKKGKQKTYLYPVFEYNVLGNTYTQKSSTGLGRGYFKYQIGQEIDIHYNSENPEEIYTKIDNSSIFMGAFIVIMGMLLILAP